MYLFFTGIEQRTRPLRYRFLIDATSVRELGYTRTDANFYVVGAASTLSDLEELCTREKGVQAGALREAHSMLRWFAGRHVRNAAVSISICFSFTTIASCSHGRAT